MNNLIFPFYICTSNDINSAVNGIVTSRWPAGCVLHALHWRGWAPGDDGVAHTVRKTDRQTGGWLDAWERLLNLHCWCSNDFDCEWTKIHILVCIVNNCLHVNIKQQQQQQNVAWLNHCQRFWIIFFLSFCCCCNSALLNLNYALVAT